MRDGNKPHGRQMKGDGISMCKSIVQYPDQALNMESEDHRFACGWLCRCGARVEREQGMWIAFLGRRKTLSLKIRLEVNLISFHG